MILAYRDIDRGTNMMELKGAIRNYVNAYKQQFIHEHKSHYTGNDTVTS